MQSRTREMKEARLHSSAVTVRPLRVSVIIPVYNAADTVKRALDSVTTQTLQELEIIAYNDCSTDHSREVLARFAERETRLRVVQGDINRGAAFARNRAIRLARGRWIALLDADDWYAPQRLETLVDLAEAADSDFIADNQFFYDAAAGQLVGTALPASLDFRPIGLNELLTNSMTGQSRFDYGLLKPIIRRDFLLRHEVNYIDECRNGQDFYLYLDCFVAGARGALSFVPSYYYTQPRGAKSLRSSRAEPRLYDFGTMKRTNDAAVARHQARLSGRQIGLLHRRGRAIESCGRYQSIKAKVYANPWYILAVPLRPGVWPQFARAAYTVARAWLAGNNAGVQRGRQHASSNGPR